LFGIPSQENEAGTDSATASSSSETSNTFISGELAIVSPIKGKVIPLSEVPDEAFSGGEMGKGVGIEPAEGKVYAPFDGTVDMLFDTKHALGLISSEGVEMLIHIGLDTVELNGKYFTAHVNTGDSFKKGQLLIEFDRDSIAGSYSTITPVLVTNFDQYGNIEGISGMTADNNTTIIKIR
jgi:PTS system beta-glucosides-specific IIC component